MSLPAFRYNDQVTRMGTFKYNTTSTLERFGLTLVESTNKKWRGYQVMLNGKVWYYTGCIKYAEAVKETVRELQLRCYLPVNAQAIVDNCVINRRTNLKLQQHIKQYAHQSAVLIQCAIELLQQLALLLGQPASDPSQMKFNPLLRTYLMTWGTHATSPFFVKIDLDLTVSLKLSEETFFLKHSGKPGFDQGSMERLAAVMPSKKKLVAVVPVPKPKPKTLPHYLIPSAVHQPVPHNPLHTPIKPVRKTIAERKQTLIDELTAELNGY